MRRLPKKIQQIIKRERFDLDSTQPESRWGKGVKIKYRISGITTEYAKWQPESTPMDKNLHQEIWVNIKVSGVAETAVYQDTIKGLRPIAEVAKYSNNTWNSYNNLWGYQYHKQIRDHIRHKVQSEIENFLKLMGIQAQGWCSLKIKTIGWE
jgi:predicted phosphoadenosine phosphosulfate sulfurtransferase